jgi:hypothetical protein
MEPTMSTLPIAVPQEGLRARIRDFFYKPEVPYGIALARIVLPLVLLFAMVPRWYFARELFSTDGAPILLWEAYGARPWLPTPSGAIAVAINSLVILTLVTSSLGWCTRISLALTTVGYVYLNTHEIIGTMNKYSVISTHILFLLSLSQCGSTWSIDNWLRRSRLARRGVPPDLLAQPRKFPAASRRLLQLFIGAVYIGAATTKLHVPAYFTGEQLATWMITDYNLPNFFGSRFAMHPSLLVTFAYIALAWETLFIFIAWRGAGRIAMLGLGVTFHMLTWLTLGLWVFPLVCYSTYFSFLNENDVERIEATLARWRLRGRGFRSAVGRLLRERDLRPLPALRPATSHALFVALAVLVALGGVGLEYKLDPYGIRRPEGPYTLKALDPKRVSELLGPTERLRNEDKVLHFDVGSIFVAGAVLDRRTQFRQGETMRIQCGLCPPHEDLWIECNLHDSENRVVDTSGVFMGSENLRALFYYNLRDCTAPGDYSLVLRIAGEEIMRRPVKVLPRVAWLGN